MASYSSIDYNCVFNAGDFMTMFACLDTGSGGILFNFGFFVFMCILIALWSWAQDIEQGFMFGGLFASIIAIALFLAHWLMIETVFVAIIVTLIGVSLKIYSVMNR